MQKRAKSGGEVAMNGEFYHGGEFLPTTQLPSQPKARKVVRQPRRSQIARYEWAETPEGKRSIFTAIIGTVAQERNGVMSRFEPAIAHYGEMTAGRPLDELIAAWNAGERWMET